MFYSDRLYSGQMGKTEQEMAVILLFKMKKNFDTRSTIAYNGTTKIKANLFKEIAISYSNDIF